MLLQQVTSCSEHIFKSIYKCCNERYRELEESITKIVYCLLLKRVKMYSLVNTSEGKMILVSWRNTHTSVECSNKNKSAKY